YQRFDLGGGPVRTFFVGDTQSLQECGFVPRKGSTEEGDGYLMGVASNYAEMASELHIIDAQRMEAGSIAVVKLPFRLRSGTHVNWFSAAEIAEQRAEAGASIAGSSSAARAPRRGASRSPSRCPGWPRRSARRSRRSRRRETSTSTTC